jgi:hypothetical protein
VLWLVGLELLKDLRCLERKITMAKRWIGILALLLAFPYCAAKEPKPLPMPPLTSHGQPISKFACTFMEQPNPSRDVDSFWNLTVFAEYGKDHKRYWAKSLGTFPGKTTVTSSNGESVKSGNAVGPVVQQNSFGEAGNLCVQWKVAVHDMIQKASGPSPNN